MNAKPLIHLDQLKETLRALADSPDEDGKQEALQVIKGSKDFQSLFNQSSVGLSTFIWNCEEPPLYRILD